MKVTIYSAEWCHWCHVLHDWLKKHNVEFEEKDVQNDHAAAEELIKVSGQAGIPVAVVRKSHSVRVVVGFDEEALKEALGI